MLCVPFSTICTIRMFTDTRFADKSNFRAVLATSEKWPGDQPILERSSRYLISPHPGADDKEVRPFMYLSGVIS